MMSYLTSTCPNSHENVFPNSHGNGQIWVCGSWKIMCEIIYEYN